MLSRLFLKPSNLRLVKYVTSKSQPCHPIHVASSSPLLNLTRFLSTGRGDGDGGGGDHSRSDSIIWNLTRDTDGKLDPCLSETEAKVRGGGHSQSESSAWNLSEKSDDKFEPFFNKMEEGKVGGDGGGGDQSRSDSLWNLSPETDGKSGQIFIEAEAKVGGGGGFDDAPSPAQESEAWNLMDGGKEDFFEEVTKVVAAEEQGMGMQGDEEKVLTEEDIKKLEEEEKELSVVLKGPNRAFGDLMAASGITDAMLDSLMALRDFEGIEGLPPLSEIEDLRYENSTRRSIRSEIERQKQEEIAKARVRQVDEKGRAYGTGRRKCSIARVWIQPGDGKFEINEKEFDVYFPMLEHRAAILRPFTETKTLGRWDVRCTVKGGGNTGQVGAIRLGISRALQNWEPELRPALRSVGFLTRDSRVVERKKPGKAKARKSFQWVKR